MKMILLKVTVIIVSALIAYGIIFTLVILFKHSGIEFLRQLTFWVSPLSFTGWIFFAILVFGLYKLVIKFVFPHLLIMQ